MTSSSLLGEPSHCFALIGNIDVHRLSAQQVTANMPSDKRALELVKGLNIRELRAQLR